MGCRFGEIVANKDSAASTTSKVVCATPTNVFAGFVAVGLAQATGKRYVPGSDDLVVDNGQHSFEFVVPWKLSKVNPEYAYKSGGEVLRLSGTHFRPGMLCTFKDSSLTSEYRFISSALAMCETRASSEAEGTVDLNLTPTHAVGGGGASVEYQTAPIIDGPLVSTTAVGGDVVIQASSSTPLSGAIASFTASPIRIGCWFDGIWVAATLRSERELVCKAPLQSFGTPSLSVVDMYAQRMFPTNATQTGWFTSFTVSKDEVVDVVLPSVGNAMRNTVADSSTLVDFFGRNLIAGSGSVGARICQALNPVTSPVLVTNQVQSKCDFPATPSETAALSTLRYGFHAVSAGAGASASAQFLIVSPPQITSVVPGFLRAGTVATFSGQNLMDPFRQTWCGHDGIALVAHAVSSALIRCSVPYHHQLPSGSSSSAHDLTIDVLSDLSSPGAGGTTMGWLPVANDLESITPNVGATSGGTRTVLKLTGGTIPTSSYYTPTCRFGTIVTSAIHVPGGGVACSSPAYAARNVTVGIDVESTIEFQYVAQIGVSAIVPGALPQNGGSISVYLDAALSSSYSADCVFVTSGGDKLKSSLADSSGTLKCASPQTGIGFATMAIVVSAASTNNTAFIDEAAGQYFDLEVQTRTPGVEVFLPTGANWVQAEEVIHAVTSDGSLLGDNSGDDDFWCVFGKAGIYGGSIYLSAASRVSGTILKCTVPDLDTLIVSGQSGFEIVIGICSSTEVSASSCTSYAGTRVRYEKKLGVSSVLPVNGTQAGGDVAVLVDSASVKGFGANVPSCRFGTIYPVAGTSVTGTGEINCVTPAHAAGVVPVSVPPLDLGLTALTFEYISVSTSQSVLSTTYGADPYVVAYLIEPTPMITEVVPWVGWSGSVVTLLGTNFPTGSAVKCRFGSVSVDAQVVSTAVIQCGDTSPITSDDVEEQRVAVTTSSGDSNPNVTTLAHYVITQGDISAIDAADGWQQGGNAVGVTVAKWVPEGYTSCRFGTITVQSRGGDGFGAIGKASVSQSSQWWSDSTDGKKIECVSPAGAQGNVNLGVSILGSTASSFIGTTFTYI